MRDYREERRRLERMENACRLNCEHLRVIDRQILAQAERMTIRDRPKKRQYGRHATTWSPADERYYRACIDTVFALRRSEVGALRRKIDRQRAAIDRLRRRLGINDNPPSFDVVMIAG